MNKLGYGDRVRVKGYEGGHEATVINLKSNNEVLVQMGTKVMTFSSDMVIIMSRSLHDQHGNMRQLSLQVGDNVKYTYPNLPANPEDSQPIRYGEIIDFISEKRVLVRWIGASEDKIERIGRLKWIPVIPGWYSKLHGIDSVEDSSKHHAYDAEDEFFNNDLNSLDSIDYDEGFLDEFNMSNSFGDY